MVSARFQSLLPIFMILDYIAPPPPFVKEENWIFELNKIQGELKFFKIKREGEKRGKGEFLKVCWGKIAGDET